MINDLRCFRLHVLYISCSHTHAVQDIKRISQPCGFERDFLPLLLKIVTQTPKHRWVVVELEMTVGAPVQNQWTFWCHRVLGFPWHPGFMARVEQCIYNRGRFEAPANEEEHADHVPDLMPEKGLASDLKKPYILR